MTPTPTLAPHEALRSVPDSLLNIICNHEARATVDEVRRMASELQSLRAQAAERAVPAGVTPELLRMTPRRAAFFMERFLKEEKLLGPNEQAALNFVIAMLEGQHAPAQPVPKQAGEKAQRAAAFRGLRLDSIAFKRGVRAFKTGASNPFNGPELRDEWEAGRTYARLRDATDGEFVEVSEGAPAQTEHVPADVSKNQQVSNMTDPAEVGDRLELPDSIATLAEYGGDVFTASQVREFGNQQFNAGREFEAERAAARAAAPVAAVPGDVLRLLRDMRDWYRDHPPAIHYQPLLDQVDAALAAAPQPPAPSATADALDAARWRHFCQRHEVTLLVKYFGNGCTNVTLAQAIEALDDERAALAAKGEKHGT